MSSSSWLLANLLETQPCRYGVLSYFKTDSVIGRSLKEYGEWAQHEIDLLLDFIQPGDTVVDIGAFIGTHTLAFAQRVGEAGCVYAFEANPLTYQILAMNIQQNKVSNVRLFNIALSNHKNVVSVDVFTSWSENNPGAFSLADIEGSDKPKQPSFTGIPIKVAPLDDFGLENCHLIKIDVEGMEPAVLEGAQEVLHRFRPLVYAECLSVESGSRLVSLMREKNYKAFMHFISAYNPENFRKNPQNVFGKARESNILFIPYERFELCMQFKRFQELIPLNTLDDLVLAFLWKPQYKYEVLANTHAASVISCEFWANESELDQLKEQKEQVVQSLQRELEELRAQICQRDQQLQSLQAQVAEVRLQAERERKSLTQQQLVELEKQKEEWLALELALEQERATLTQQLAEKEQVVQQLQTQLAEQEQALAHLQAQLRTEREQLTQQLAEKDEALQHLQAQLTEREQVITQMQAQLQAEQERSAQQLTEKEYQVSMLQSQLVSLQQRLNWKRYRLADRMLSYYWYLWHPKQAWQQAKTRAWELGRRWLPAFIKHPIRQVILSHRTVKHQEQQARNTSPHDDSIKRGLIFNIDSLRANKNRVYGWGWLFHKEYSVRNLTLLAKVKDSWYSLPCQYGLAREDVANQYRFPNAKYSGFIASGRLPVHVIPKQFFLEIDFNQGDVYRLEISDALRQTEISVRIPRRTSTIWRWGKATLKYFAQKDFKGWLVAVRRKIQTATQSGQPLRVLDLDQLLSIIGQDILHRFCLIIDHNLGGGANQYRQSLIQREKQSSPVLLMLYDLPNLEYRLHYLYRDDEQVFRMESLDSLTELAKKAQIEEIFLNNLVSFDEPLLVAQWCLHLKRLTGAKLTIPIHDYFSICPSYTLLDDRSQFCDIPVLSRCRECLRNHKGNEFLSLVDYRDIDTWRSIWGELLTAADRILCFSQSSVDLLHRAYPKLDLAKVTVQPHSVEPLRKVPIKLDAPLHIGIVGHIYSEAKGAHVVRHMVRIIEEQQLPIRITVIGTIENPLLSPVLRVTGRYRREELPDTIERSGANLFFLPSIWPETFSYVTEELMQMGVPLAVFDLGAQAERVRKYNLGLVIPKIDAAYALNALIDFHSRLSKQPKALEVSESAQVHSRKIHVCTCIAVNYLPKARLMCSSLKQYHPEFMVHLVLVDKVPEWFDLKSEPFDDLITLEQLEIPNLKSWLFRYSVLEMCTGVKPFALKTLLKRSDCEGVFFFDPDMVFFSRLDDLVQELKQNSVLLIPHQTKPESTHEAIWDNEICSLKHGIFNLGFIGVRNDEQGKAFLNWWADRLDRFCWAELEQGVWTDQKWVNFAPVFFENVKIIKSSRFDVAPWNITTRNLQGSVEEGLTVDGKPLGFYHFTGFDSGAHEIMAMKYGGDNKAIKSLIQWYKTAIQEDARAANTPWGYACHTTFDNGEPITQAHRIIYKRRRDLQEAYPDPFKVVEDEQCYYNWFRWRAAIEHPEIVQRYSESSQDQESPTKGQPSINWRRVRNYLKRALTDHQYGKRLWRTAWFILRTEGYKGLKRYLIRP